MNPPLEQALQELRDFGAQGLPSVDEIEAAAEGSTWTGTSAQGNAWELVKNNAESYNTRF